LTEGHALPGGCAWGHYRSARAPVEEDFVTGTPDTLRKMAAGRERRADGVSVVNGVASHIEAFVGGTKPTDPDEATAWPFRVFLADDGGTLLKAEARGPDGKPTTLFEVTQLTWGAPAGASLAPPTGCTFGNNARIARREALYYNASSFEDSLQLFEQALKYFELTRRLRSMTNPRLTARSRPEPANLFERTPEDPALATIVQSVRKGALVLTG
jgi:hypothetical protein